MLILAGGVNQGTTSLLYQPQPREFLNVVKYNSGDFTGPSTIVNELWNAPYYGDGIHFHYAFVFPDIDIYDDEVYAVITGVNDLVTASDYAIIKLDI